MASINRTAYPRLYRQLTQDELLIYYALTGDEKTVIKASAKGQRQVLTIAVLLKTRQHLGYFPSLSDIPDQVIQFVAEQLITDEKSAFIKKTVQRASLSRYRTAIRAHLGSKSYSAYGRPCVTDAIQAAALTMSDPADLINVAVECLIKANIELPAFSTLDRLAGHIRQIVHQQLYVKITGTLTRKQQDILESLLIVLPDKSVTQFNLLKQSPGTPTLSNVRLWIDHLQDIEALLDPSPFLTNTPHTKVRQFAAQAEALEVSDILDIRQPGKRHTLLLCLLRQAQTRTRDELAEMFLRRMRRTRNAALEKLRNIHDRHREVEEDLVSTLGQILYKATINKHSTQELGADVLSILETCGGVGHLLEQYDTVSAYHQNNYLPLLWKIHVPNRSALFRLLTLLDIRSANQDTRLTEALAFVITHRSMRRDFLPTDIDISFLSKKWHNFVTADENNQRGFDRRSLEVCVLLQVSNALACGDLYVEYSETYNDPRTQMLSWEECQDRLSNYCSGVGLADNPVKFIARLKEQLARVATKVDAGFPDNTELTIDLAGTPHLKRQAKTADPEKLKAFQKAVRSRMPERHLLDILKNTNHWASYTRHFGPPSGSDPKLLDAAMKYIFAVFGNGCFLGDSQTARHAPSPIDRQTLRRINAQHINGENLEAGLTDLINEYARFQLPAHWGDGGAAITDGTHIALTENTLLGERHIRYGGYGGIAYHHIADNYVALFSNFIACGVWEAVYIFDGLLQNKSNIQANTLHADTHGQSEPVFGLAHMLGIKLFPRMRTWNDVKFYRPTKGTRYKHIDALFTDTIDWELIERHWQDLMQIVLSIQAGKILPSLILRKLSSKNRKSKLYRAFRELGRVKRTIFLLRYISEHDFRFSIRAETTKIESFHSFLDWIAFGGTVIKSGDPIEQAKRVKYMDIVANAIMLHNVVDLTTVLNGMTEEGVVVTPELIRFLSPYMREHILRFGKWMLDMDDESPALPTELLIEADRWVM